MSQGNHVYIDHVRRLEQRLGSGDEAMRLAVGGEFEAVGNWSIISCALWD